MTVCFLVLGQITSFHDMVYDIGVTPKEPFSCLFTSNPQPDAILQLDGATVPGTYVQSESQYQYRISIPIMAIDVKTAGIYSCLVSYSGSSFNLSSTAQIQSQPKAMLIVI